MSTNNAMEKALEQLDKQSNTTKQETNLPEMYIFQAFVDWLIKNK